MSMRASLMDMGPLKLAYCVHENPAHGQDPTEIS